MHYHFRRFLSPPCQPVFRPLFRSLGLASSAIITTLVLANSLGNTYAWAQPETNNTNTTPSALAPTCPAPTTYTPPSRRRRIIDIADWNASFAVPNNYRALRMGQTIQVLSPEGFAQFQCRRMQQITNDNVPIGITLNFAEGAVTEASIRQQALEEAGSFLGETKIDQDTAFVHTSNLIYYSLHLSRPTPDNRNTVVFTSVLSDAGEIFYEDTFDIIRGTFAFTDTP